MASVPRSEKILNGLAARSGITECGKLWLQEALDPFHDTITQPTGYPDTNGSASVIQCVKQSYQIAAPTGLAGANWDCNIVMMPWLNTLNILPTAQTGNANKLSQINVAGGGTTPGVGGVQVMSAASGTVLNIVNLQSNGTTTINQSFTIPAVYQQGNSRVVAMAMEIVNTTSDLNRQGLVTVYRVPVPQNDDGTGFVINKQDTGDTVGFNGVATGLLVPAPPTSIAAAQLFAGTKAWAAEFGSYNTAVFNTPDVPAQGLNFTQPVIYVIQQTDNSVGFTQMNKVLNSIVATTGEATVPPVFWTEFDMSGSYFTGLSNTTTLTVNYVVYIERFPTQDDLDLIVSARRSPEYDIKALEAYSIIAQSLPVAVRFDENGLGDWFKSAVNMASEYLTPVLSAIPHPYAQVAVQGIKYAKGFTDSFDQPASEVKVRPAHQPPAAPPLGNYKSASNQKRRPILRGKLASADNRLRADIASARKSLAKTPKRR